MLGIIVLQRSDDWRDATINGGDCIAIWVEDSDCIATPLRRYDSKRDATSGLGGIVLQHGIATGRPDV